MRNYWLFNVVFAILVCRIFIVRLYDEADKVQKDISAYLKDKTLISITQSSESRATIITIIAKVDEPEVGIILTP